ncbi:MAG: RloB domain-containing protein [Spirochaetales bacterium]|nr:RloB domain-containing protein [Spirochaetales bacterium]
MGHKKRTRERPADYREDYLIVIAVEGAKTEKHYFESVTNAHRFSRFKIHVIPNIEDKSAPEYILDNLDSYKEKNGVDDKDFLYLVCDRDGWEESALAEVLSKCRKKDYNFIVSNPCFELWLLLHFKDLSDLSEEDQMNYLVNKKVNKNTRFLASQLKNIYPGIITLTLNLKKW